MLAPTLSKSIFAAAAIRSCGDAFVATTPRSLRSARVRVMSARRTDDGPILPKNMTDPPLLQRGASSRDVPSFASRPATKPLVVCGPSGVGKGTIISKFMERGAENPKLPKFCFSVSHTTRQPRPGEVDGVHYHFVTREFMRDKIDAGGFFLEHAEVHGNLYGTSFQAVFDVSGDGEGGRQCLLDIDVEGARSIKEFQSRQRLERERVLGEEAPSPAQRHPTKIEKVKPLPELDARFVFVAPPSADALRERLAGRGTESPEALERRLRNAAAELEYGRGPGNFDAVVVNDDLDRACAEFERVVEELYVD